MIKEEIKRLRREDFPPQLLEIPEPPKELWVAGVLPSPNTVLLTVVGSRKHTSYGREVCEELVAGLSGYDIAIVSGLALGIDAIAHESAMRANLKTIAVPGSGLDPSVLYPRSHVPLAERILEHGGALLSEFEPEFRATPYAFPQRNRIMAGLANATLLIEASERSGTLITARLASDYSRDVLVVPGSIFSEQSRGCHQFLKLGATPVTCTEDILHALGFVVHEERTSREKPDGFDEITSRIWDLLIEPLDRDALIARIGISPSEANVILMKMEIAGYIVSAHGTLRRSR